MESKKSYRKVVRKGGRSFVIQRETVIGLRVLGTKIYGYCCLKRSLLLLVLRQSVEAVLAALAGEAIAAET